MTDRTRRTMREIDFRSLEQRSSCTEDDGLRMSQRSPTVTNKATDGTRALIASISEMNCDLGKRERERRKQLYAILFNRTKEATSANVKSASKEQKVDSKYRLTPTDYSLAQRLYCLTTLHYLSNASSITRRIDRRRRRRGEKKSVRLTVRLSSFFVVALTDWLTLRDRRNRATERARGRREIKHVSN